MAKLTREERDCYHVSLDAFRTNLAVMDHERNEGRREGRMEGLMEGRKEATLANALNLKKNGVPVDIIAKSLGLPIEEIENL
jgi:predicted transposase/invertase (TIGR01784 family)